MNNIIKKYELKTFKHSKNINNIIKSLPILGKLDGSEYKFYISGGYAAALLFAPRSDYNLNCINSAYYSDIDIYFSKEEEFNLLNKKIQEYIKKIPDDTIEEDSIYVSIISETENAITYRINSKESSEIYQLIKKDFLKVREQLKKFDLINSTVAFSFHKNAFYCHKDLFMFHLSKRIGFFNPHLILPQNPDYPESIALQLLRISKYCIRWDYDLSPEMFSTLVSLYEKHPNLNIKANQAIHSYTGSTVIKNAINLWEHYSSILVTTKYWEYYQPLNKASVLTNIIKQNQSVTEVPF